MSPVVKRFYFCRVYREPAIVDHENSNAGLPGAAPSVPADCNVLVFVCFSKCF